MSEAPQPASNDSSEPNETLELAKLVIGISLLITGLLSLDPHLLASNLEAAHHSPNVVGTFFEFAQALGLPDILTSAILMGSGAFVASKSHFTREIFNSAFRN